MANPKKDKSNFGFPGAFAQARNAAGGDWAAGVLLYRIHYRWHTVSSKLDRCGKEWLAMSREELAIESGLSMSELKNRALPKLRKLPFIEIRAMKLGKIKKLWFRLEDGPLEDHFDDWEWYLSVLNGSKPIGYHPEPSYPYKKVDEWDSI